MQIPVQGIGDWPHPLVNPEINDVGLRNLAGKATAISLQLNPKKTLLKLTLTTLCNDMLIGMMGITLAR